MGFSRGDKVKAKKNINGGMKWNVSKGQPGVVTKVRMSGKVDVEFRKDGIGQANVELTDISQDDLEKRY